LDIALHTTMDQWMILRCGIKFFYNSAAMFRLQTASADVICGKSKNKNFPIKYNKKLTEVSAADT
jgi:hypothetical protein